MAELATITKTMWFSKVTHWENLLYVTQTPSYGVNPPHHCMLFWYRMECGCRLEIESSDAHLSCWAQMHCSPHAA